MNERNEPSVSLAERDPRNSETRPHQKRPSYRLTGLFLLLAAASPGPAQDAAARLSLEQLLPKREACVANSRCAPDMIHNAYQNMAAASNAFSAQLQAAASSVSILNGASAGPSVSPGAWITIQGLNLASTTRTWSAADFNGDLLPTALSGTSVRIGDKDAALSYISPTQINALIPPDVITGQTTVTVTSPVGPAVSTTIKVDPFAPGLFMFDQRYVAAQLPDGTLAGKQGLFSGNPTSTRPVKAGQPVTLYATGLGTTNPEVAPGRYFSDPRPMNGSTEYFHVTIGGQPAAFTFVGAVSPGLYQINVSAPMFTSGDYPVLIDYGGFSSQAGAMITIQGDPSLSKLQASPSPITMQAYTTGTTPSSQPLQLLSTGEDFDFNLQSSAAWMTFDKQSGRTPATVQVLADGRGLTPGTYNERITVLAPGTASPSTTITVTVTATSAPQITVSQTALSYQLVTGYESISIPINVLSGAGNVDFTVSKTGDTWLSVPTSGRTPGVVSIGLNSESRAAGVVTGSVRITPAGGGQPRDISVSLTILSTAAAGSPQIVALDADDLLWGTSGSFGIYGQNLDGATAVNISPSIGITVDSVKSSTSARVNMNLAVDPTASEGVHTITVTTSRGSSNAFPFAVRRGQPQIRDLGPTVVNPGRFYSSFGNFESGYAVPQVSFGTSGVDLTGISSIQVDQSDSITALPGVGSPGVVHGVLMVGDNAQTGTRRLSVVTPGGRTNELAFEVQPPSPNAPVISNLTLSSTCRPAAHRA